MIGIDNIRLFLKKLIKRTFKDAQYTGELGELYARCYLRKQAQYRIITHNWSYPPHEIDIIALDQDVLVFIEVKTRQFDALQSGYYAVDKNKKKSLVTVINAYKRQLKERPNNYRFDIVEVKLKPNLTCEIYHYKNASLI